MQLVKDKTLLLFGRSPFINKIRGYIPKLIENYHSVGINSFCETFPSVEYTAFFDDVPFRLSDETTIVTNIRYAQDKNRKFYEACINHKKAEYYLISRDKSRFSEDSKTLNFFYHTPTMVLNWAYLKGFENVILAGVDLVGGIGHFDNPKFIPNWKPQDLEDAREHLETVCTKYLNIYQLNPESNLKLPKINIEELMLWD